MKDKFLASAKVTSRCQVVIPKKVRQQFGIKEGDVLIFFDKNGKLVLEIA